MCGITGIFSFKEPASKSLLEGMTEAISHRGPNAFGYFESKDGKCVLGHRRLSVIDLSESANQPMQSACKRYLIVFNGEVYNFQEIKKEIQQYSAVDFSTSSDTEVLVEAFALWGKAFVYKLNGMFTMAIYDTKEEVLWLFRDRLGIKPLYYYMDDDLFAFSSELKSLVLLKKEKGPFHLNKQALNQYLRLGYIPEPNSIYTEIKKFEAAHLGAVSKDGFSNECYWNIDKKVSSIVHTDESQAKKKLKELIESSVQYRLISDVPFGTFLSGGIDSSTITAVAQSISDKPVNTFSIGFKEAEFNESVHAAKIANHLKTNHHEFMVSYNDAIEHFEQIIQTYDEPFADSSSIPTMLVSRLAKKHVTMTLSGDGGDEQFMGYGFYNWAKRLNNPFVNMAKAPLNFGLSKTSSNRNKRAALMFDYNKNTHLPSHIFSVEQYYFSSPELNDILSDNFKEDVVFEQADLERELSVSEHQALFDVKHYLKDNLLVKVDRASMRYSLETRVPLLDHRIVEFTLNLDEKLKYKNKESKYLLKQVLYDYLPKEYFDRPKWGFGVPIKLWLQKELKYLVDDYLDEKILEKYGMFDIAKVKEIEQRYFAGEDYLFNKLWLIIILNQWLETNAENTVY
ncbi:MAG: asparagine synthase (glutamine-hydrolyzing) [Bacteroidia bacterium]|jgi:asparagine synthase (glutamine-hydrolysing)